MILVYTNIIKVYKYKNEKNIYCKMKYNFFMWDILAYFKQLTGYLQQKNPEVCLHTSGCK